MTSPAASISATRQRRRAGTRIRNSERIALVLLVDAFAAVVATNLAALATFVLTGFAGDSTPLDFGDVAAWQIAFVLAWVVVLRAFGAGDLVRPRLGRRSLRAVLSTVITLTCIRLGLFFLFPFTPGHRFLVAIPIAGLLTLAARFAYLRLTSSPLRAQRVVMMGVDEASRRVAQVIGDASTGLPYTLVAFVDPARSASAINGIPVVSGEQNLWESLDELDVDLLVVGRTEGLPAQSLSELVRCFERGIGAVAATTLYEELTGRVMVSSLEADWYAEIPTRTAGLYAPVKRGVDLLVTCASVVLLPLYLVIGVAIALESRGPIVVRQTRIGQRGERFVLHKFRTMRMDAEADGEPRWSPANDPRRTRVGRFLRRTHFDELPQLWNVLRGEMSLIGPRPERPEFVDRLNAELPLYRARSLVRPGITGWAQVLFPYADSVEWNLVKLEFDLYYVRHFGPLLDLSIALRTIAVVTGLAKPDYADRAPRQTET